MSTLARALLDHLEPEDLAELADRLAPYLQAPAASDHPPPGVYSPATLAAELGRSPRAIRAAIARGELQAVKRGAGWVIPAEAVAAWSRADRPVRTSAPRRRRARAPRSNGGPMTRALRP